MTGNAVAGGSRRAASPHGEVPANGLARGHARETLCRLLAACYYQPGPEFAEERVFDAMGDAAACLDPALAAPARALGAEFARVGPDALLVDYTRLFLGPARVVAKPYGSVWLDAQETMMGPSTLAVLDLYREGGFEIEDGFRELPDHIAAELEFLYLLIHRENRAHRQGDGDELRQVRALERRLLGEHLGRWVGPFTRAVRAEAEAAFYRQLAELTERFVSGEARAIEEHA